MLRWETKKKEETKQIQLTTTKNDGIFLVAIRNQANLHIMSVLSFVLSLYAHTLVGKLLLHYDSNTIDQSHSIVGHIV